MKKPKTIGILGGMGPSATADLFQRILAYSQDKYSAVQDYEYPPVIMRSIPLDGFDETGVTNEELVKTQLIDGVHALEAEGSDVIVIPCNTVHYYFTEMQSAVNIPILNVVHETIKGVSNAHISKIGLLCSDSTHKTHFYQRECSEKQIEVLEPNDEQQKKITKVIKNVMGGKQGQRDKEVLMEIAMEYVNNGAEAVVLACTEMPLAISQSDINITLFDSTQILAERVVDISMNQ